MNYKNVKIDKTAKIAKQSVIIGDVTIGSRQLRAILQRNPRR